MKKCLYAVNLFKQFALQNGLPPSETIPASERTLAAFSALLAGTRAESIIWGVVSAVKA
jgi:hypothetical protein